MFRVFFLECKNNKKTVKLCGLACVVVLHNLCIDRGDLVPRKFDLTSDHASNKRLSPDEVRDALALQSTNQENFEINKKTSSIKSSKSINY